MRIHVSLKNTPTIFIVFITPTRKKSKLGGPAMAQSVKDPALLQLLLRFNPWTRNSAEEGDVVVFHGARGLPRLEVHHFPRMRLQ